MDALQAAMTRTQQKIASGAPVVLQDLLALQHALSMAIQVSAQAQATQARAGATRSVTYVNGQPVNVGGCSIANVQGTVTQYFNY